MPDLSMIIEFIGTPGSGKTTLIPVLAKILNDYNYVARSIVEASRPFVARTLIGNAVIRFSPNSLRDPLLWQLFYFLSYLSRKGFSMAHPALVSHVRESQRNRDISADERKHNLYWWFHLTGYYQFLKPRMQTGEALIIDEGFVHRVVQLNASDHEGLDQVKLNTYISLIPRPDILIFVDVPADLCEQRVYERGLWPRFQHKSRAQVSQYISNSGLVVNTTVDIIKSMGWDVIEVVNSGDDLLTAERELKAKVPQLLNAS